MQGQQTAFAVFSLETSYSSASLGSEVIEEKTKKKVTLNIEGSLWCVCTACVSSQTALINTALDPPETVTSEVKEGSRTQINFPHVTI